MPAAPQVTLTLFEGRHARQKNVWSGPLDAVPELLGGPWAPRKEDLPMWSFGVSGDKRTANRALRSKENLLAINGVPGDHDRGTMTIDAAVERLTAAGIVAIVKPTPSHTAEHPHWHVLAPTSIPLPPERHGGLVSRLNAVLGGALEPESWVPSQAYFYGTVGRLERPRLRRPGSEPDGAGGTIHIIHGWRYIDEADDIEVVAPPRTGKPGNGTDTDDEPHTSAEPEAPIGSVVEALALIPNDDEADRPWENGHDGWNEIGMAIFRATGGSDDGFAAFDEWSARSVKYDAEHTRERWDHWCRSSPPTRIGFGTLVYLARQADPDWRPPHHYDDRLGLDFEPWDDPPADAEDAEPETEDAATAGAAGNSATRAAQGSTAKAHAGAKRRKLNFIRAYDVRPQLENAYLVKGLLGHEQLSLMIGKPGCGKSFLTLDRDLSIAAGISWFGHKTTPGPIVYLALEAGAKIIQNRIYAWLEKHDLVGHDIPFVAITSPVDLCHMRAGDVPLLVQTIKNEIGFERLSLLEIDTVSRAMAGGDENAPDDMGAFVHALDRLREELHCHVAAVHHPGKDTGRGPRGWSGLPAAVDTWQEVARIGDTGISSYTVTRQRDAIAGERCHFKLPPVQLGIDQEADPVTTCTVEPVDAPDEQGQGAASVKLSDRDICALDQLKAALKAAGIVPPATPDIPPDKTCVLLDVWRRYAIVGGISASEGQDAQRAAFRRAAEKLVAHGVVRRHGEWVWLP